MDVFWLTGTISLWFYLQTVYYQLQQFHTILVHQVGYSNHLQWTSTLTGEELAPAVAG